LLISHPVGIRLGEFQYSRELGYLPILNKFWVVSPDFALPRQLLLLLVLWIHGCIGLRAWLRTKRAYYRATGARASRATLVPVLAILGVVNAGLNLREAVLRDPVYAASLGPAPDSKDAQFTASVVRIADGMAVFYLGLVIVVFGLRGARNWHAKRFRAVRIWTSCRYRPIRLLRAGSKPLDRDSARVRVRRPRPLLDLQSPHRRECATSRGSQSGGARHAKANWGSAIGTPCVSAEAKGRYRRRAAGFHGKGLCLQCAPLRRRRCGRTGAPNRSYVCRFTGVHSASHRPITLRCTIHLRPIHPGGHTSDSAQWRSRHQHRRRWRNERLRRGRDDCVGGAQRVS